MATNLPISGLTPGVAITDTNLFADTQTVGNGPMQVTALQIKQYVGNNLTLTGTTVFPQNITIGTIPYVFPATGGAVGTVLTNDGSGNLSWQGGTNGTVTSVDVSGGLTGLTTTGGAITTAGVITLGGVLNVAYGGTGATTAAQALINLLPTTNLGTQGYALFNNGAGGFYWAAAGGGGGGGGTGVPSFSAGSTGLQPSAVTTGAVTLSGVLNVASGGTGRSTVPANGQLLIGNGTGYSLTTLTQGPGVTITNTAGGITISATGTSGVSTFSGGPTGLTPNVPTSGPITLGGKLGIAYGGTNLTTIGATGTTLVSNGTALAYGYPAQATSLSGGTLGQVPYQSAPGVTAWSGPGAANTYLAGNGIAAPTWKAAQTTLGTTVLTLNGTTTVLNGLTGQTMAAAYGPAAGQDVATKAYVDSVAVAVNRIAPVECATVANITTFPFTGLAAIDGYTPVAGDRILVKNQTTSSQNGVWVAAAGNWTRATDLDQPTEFTSASVFVLNGTVNKDTSWIQTLTVTTVGTSAQNWLQQTGLYNYVAGTGITISPGTTINNDGVLTFQCDSAMGLTPTTATKGPVTLGGVLNLTNGGTGATDAVGARTNILPGQASNAGKFLQTNGTDVVWAAPSAVATNYISVSAPNTIPLTISGAGFTDVVGASYVLYNGTASSITLTATALTNPGSFANCTATNLVIEAGATMMITTTVVGSTYSIDASSYNAATGINVVSVASSALMSAVITASGATDKVDEIYVITNTNTAASVITATVANADAFPGFTTSANFTIPAKGTATVITTVANSTYAVINISNSVATNLSGGSANVIPYQTAANTTAFLPAGTAGQVLKSNGTASAPSWGVAGGGASFISVAGNNTVALTISGASLTDAAGNTYVLYNNNAFAVSVTTTAFDNFSSFAANATATTLTLQPKQTATIVTDTVGTNYSIVAVSSLSNLYDLALTTSNNVSALLLAATIKEFVGQIITFTNTTAITKNLLATSFLSYQAYQPAASATTIKVAPGQSVTIGVDVVGSTYQVISMTSLNVTYVDINAAYSLSSIGNNGFVNGDEVVLYNSSASAVTVLAASFNNYLSYADTCTATTFTVAAKSTLTVAAVDASVNDIWTIISYKPAVSAGNKYISLTTAGPQTINAAITAAGFTDIAGAQYVIYNSTAANTVLTGTFNNGDSFPNNVATTNLTLASKQTAVIITTTAGTTYSIDSVSAVKSYAASTFGFAGVAASAAYDSAGVVQYPGALLELRNTNTLGNSSITGTFAGFQSYQPAASASGISLQPNQSVLLAVVTPNSTYEIVSMTTQDAQINATGNVLLSNYRGDLVKGQKIFFTNTVSPAASLTITAAAFDNYQSYSSSSTATVFTLPADATVGLMLTSATANNWAIISYSVAGGAAANYFSLLGAGPQSVSAAITAAGLTDSKGAVYVIRNNSGGSSVLTGTFDNAASYPAIVTGSNLTLANNQSVTLVTDTVGTNYSIVAVSSSSSAASTVLFNCVNTGAGQVASAALGGNFYVQKFIGGAVQYNPSGYYDSATGAFTPGIAGWYRFTNRVGTQASSGGQEVAAQVCKNGTSSANVVAALDVNAQSNPMAEVNGIVYLNGTTDYIIPVYYVSGAVTGFNNGAGANCFTAELISANVNYYSATGNFNLSTSVASQTLPALLAAQTNPITDVINNLYVINNSGASPIVITATGFSGYQAWPTQATATSITIPVGGYAEVMTTSAGNGYQIIMIAQPSSAGTVAFAVTTAGAQAIGTTTTYPANVIPFSTIRNNPQGYYDATTGKFQPKIAGYYQINAMLNDYGSPNNPFSVDLYKNGSLYSGSSSFSTSFAGTGTISEVVYMDGVGDYLQVGAFATTGFTPAANAFQFSGVLATQQSVQLSGTTGNYNITLSIGQVGNSINQVLLAQTPAITDAINNIYVINNPTGSPIALTGNFSGYAIYPANATATTLTIPAGGNVELMTTSAGTGYQIVFLNTSPSSVAFKVTDNFTPPATGLQTVTAYDAIVYNAGNAFINGLGKFQPTIAGYYQMNLEVVRLSGGFISGTIKMNGTTTGQIQYNETAGGNFPSVTCSEVFYFNGTTDYAQAQVGTGGTANAYVTFSGVQVSVAPPASTPPVTTPTAFNLSTVVTTPAATWGVTTLDNISAAFYTGVGSYTMSLATTAGTAKLYGSLQFGPANTGTTTKVLTGLDLTTTPIRPYGSYTDAGVWYWTVWDSVSNHYYKITANFTNNINCSILIERVF